MNRDIDVAVIGGGAAGLAAAIKAYENGMKVTIFEWADELGGILPQCVHPGFGLEYFKKDLTGPEYIERFIDKVENYGIQTMTNSMIVQIKENNSDNGKKLVVCGPDTGLIEAKSKAVILTTGCRERARHNLNLPGDRVAGVFTAGTAQRFMDIEGFMPGKEVVVLGSGDVGMIMARRFAQEGAKVKGVYELMPFPGGLTRNVVQCLEDYNIPLHLSHTVTRINGRKRVESVNLARVDKKFNPIPGTEKEVKCDTLILSVGLIPDCRLPKILPADMGIELDENTNGPIVNELLETSQSLTFAAGNFLMVNDMVDDVTLQGEMAGKFAADIIKNGYPSVRWKPTIPGDGIRFVVPHKVSGLRDVTFYMRVEKPMENVHIEIPEIDRKIFRTVVRPPEMVKIDLNAEDIKKVDKLTFQIQTKSS